MTEGLLPGPWSLIVVPAGGFVVLTTQGHVTEGQLTAMKAGVPYELRDRVLFVGGVHFQAAA